MTDLLLAEKTFSASPGNLQQVRCLVKEQARNAGCSEALVQKLVLVVDEACANIIRHGYHGDPDGSIQLRLERRNQRLVFELRDYADPVDPCRIKPRDLSECRPGGLGINFIDSVMDDWEFRRPATGKGNILYMTRKIE